MSKHENATKLVNEGRANTVSVANLILLILILVLGLTGQFVPKSILAPATPTPAPVVVQPKADPTPAPAAAPTPAPKPAAPTATVGELKDFYDTLYVKGNKDAKVTILEFSDFQCPFCKRHNNQGTLEQVMEKYGDDVNVMFAHFPLSFHPYAQKASEASECVAEQGGDDAFYAFKKAIFAEDAPTRETIKKVVSAMDGIDADAVEECIDAGTYAKKVADTMAQGRKWGVSGTPGNLVIDNEKGTITKVSGAVPASAFDGPISAILGK